MVWSIVAFIFSLSAAGGCWFMRIDGNLDFNSPYYILGEATSDEDATRSGMGPLGFQEAGSDQLISFTCLSYSGSGILQDFMDGSWRASRAFAILGVVLCAIVMLGMILLSCFPYPQWALRAFSAASVVGGISESLIFLLFGSKLTEEPFNGSFFIGAGVTIVSVCLALGTALTILLIPTLEDAESSRNVRVVARPAVTSSPRSSGPPAPAPSSHKRNFPAPPRQQQKQEGNKAPSPAEQPAFAPGTETVTETLLPDGSKQVTTTVVGADGSRQETCTIVQTQTQTA